MLARSASSSPIAEDTTPPLNAPLEDPAESTAASSSAQPPFQFLPYDELELKVFSFSQILCGDFEKRQIPPTDPLHDTVTKLNITLATCKISEDVSAEIRAQVLTGLVLSTQTAFDTAFQNRSSGFWEWVKSWFFNPTEDDNVSYLLARDAIGVTPENPLTEEATKIAMTQYEAFVAAHPECNGIAAAAQEEKPPVGSSTSSYQIINASLSEVASATGSLAPAPTIIVTPTSVTASALSPIALQPATPDIPSSALKPADSDSEEDTSYDETGSMSGSEPDFDVINYMNSPMRG